MTDPKIVTDADTVARLARKARAIDIILGDDGPTDRIVLIEPVGGDPMVACVGWPNADGTYVAVSLEDGDVWHYDPDTDTGTPAAAAVEVGVHADGPHFTAEGSCFCLSTCCNSADGHTCTCQWGCVDIDHKHG